MLAGKFGKLYFARSFAAEAGASEAKIHKKLVRFTAENEKEVEVQAVYEDSLSSGSNIGTVVAFHGSPGSHNDFKYIRRKFDDWGIRFIGINYPGFKQTPKYSGQQHCNSERQSYSNSLIKELDIQGKIVIMGHSRGCENALMTATTINPHGLVMMNPLGLRPHKTLPLSKLRFVENLYNRLPKFIADPMVHKMYSSFGLKVRDGEEAMSSLKSVVRFGLKDTLPFIRKFAEQDTKHFLIFGGSDFIVEPQIVLETLEEYKGLTHFDFKHEIPADDVVEILKTFDSAKGASVFVARDTHYQNKLRADVVAEVTKKILTVTK